MSNNLTMELIKRLHGLSRKQIRDLQKTKKKCRLTNILSDSILERFFKSNFDSKCAEQCHNDPWEKVENRHRTILDSRVYFLSLIRRNVRGKNKTSNTFSISSASYIFIRRFNRDAWYFACRWRRYAGQLIFRNKRMW